MIKYNSRYLLGAAMALVLASLACDLLTGGMTIEETATPPPTTESAEATPVLGDQTPVSPPPAETTAPPPAETTAPPPEATLPPPDTPTPTPTECEPFARFVSDVTVPDGTEFEVGAAFEKIWRVRSEGCGAWPAGTVLVFVSGDRMGGPASAPVPSTALGATADIGVNLTAPDTPGTYKGYWQLQGPDGTNFGQKFYVEIVAKAPSPPSGKADLTITDIQITPPIQLDEVPVTVYATVKNIGAVDSVPASLGFEIVMAGLGTEKPIPALTPGASQKIEFGFTADEGTYTLKFTADIQGQVDESDEGNNVRTQDMTIYSWRTFSTGGLTIGWNQSVDLDSGTVGSLSGNSDFAWNINTGGGGIVQYWLIPQNGALFRVFSATAPTIVNCITTGLQSANIDGGRYESSTSTFKPGNLPVGIYVCYKTNQGNYGAFRVNARQPDLVIGYTTWIIE